MEIDKNKSTDNSKYDYSQSNPLGSENPCDLIKPGGTVKTRGITAYDLLKPNPKLKVKRTQKEIQECCRASFDHPKILHILIDRAKGFGCKTLEKRHGGSRASISKFCRSMGFDVIDLKSKLLSNGEPFAKSSQEIYDREWMIEIRSTKKDRTWARHPAVAAYNSMKKYYADPNAHNEKCKLWALKNRDKVNNKRRRWKVGYFKRNPSAKIADLLRIRLNSAIKAQRAGRKVSAVSDLGCSVYFLVKYLEQRFKAGMSWDNRGTCWHIDHIIPLASFDLTKKREQAKACHYTNLQPMFASENISKGDRVDEQLELL